MEIKKLTQEQIDLLNKPLPDEAVSQHPTRKYLSSIKGIYVTERLNEVFGIGGWIQKNEIVSKGEIPEFNAEGKPLPKMIVLHSFLTMPEYGIELDNFGGNDNVDEGDAFKGAATDALTKMASYIGIGKDVYKGLYKDGVYQGNKTPAPAPKPTNVSSLPKTSPVAPLVPLEATPGGQFERYMDFMRFIGEAKDEKELNEIGEEIKKDKFSVAQTSVLRSKFKARKSILIVPEPAALKDYEREGFFPEELGHNPNQQEE